MSNIYIQEPATSGKVLLVTTVGDIDIELWSKEAPKACRNFVQLCLEGYYDNTVFHRVVPNFIVQGGDPNGTGEGGESIYGAPFKDEFHSRLRFVRRGLVAMANAGPNDNASQFFFTMNQTPELQNKHTIFGKVTGPTLFNMLRLQEVETDHDERPVEPHKIIKSEILVNPFDDIIPRVQKKAKKDKDDDQKKVRSKSKATKNFSLLSFGEEAEEDEERTFKASKKFSGKSKSSHDLIDDPNLSSVPAMEKSDKRKSEDRELEDKEAVRKKLKKEEKPTDAQNPDIPDKISEDDLKSKRMEEARKESRKLQKDLKAAKKKDKKEEKVNATDESREDDKESKHDPNNAEFLEKFKLERQKYKNLKKEQNKKGQSREAQTLALLSKFQSKLSSLKELTSNYSDSEGEKEPEEAGDDDNDLSWMRHKLQFEEDKKRKVIDANVADEDRYEINDPRNPLTQRRREASKKKAKHK